MQMDDPVSTFDLRPEIACWMCAGVVCRGLPAGALAGLLGGGRDAAAARHGQEDQGQVSRRLTPRPHPWSTPLTPALHPCNLSPSYLRTHWVLCKSAAPESSPMASS